MVARLTLYLAVQDKCYHPILEAKLVTRDGLVFSLMTEFVENPAQYPDKQDCAPVLYRTGTGNSKPFIG